MVLYMNIFLVDYHLLISRVLYNLRLVHKHTEKTRHL